MAPTLLALIYAAQAIAVRLSRWQAAMRTHVCEARMVMSSAGAPTTMVASWAWAPQTTRAMEAMQWSTTSLPRRRASDAPQSKWLLVTSTIWAMEAMRCVTKCWVTGSTTAMAS